MRVRDRKLLFESKLSLITSIYHMHSPDCDAILNTVKSLRGHSNQQKMVTKDKTSKCISALQPTGRE